MASERRPNDEEYYEQRTDWLRQGDLFTEVPLGQPWPPNAVEHKAGSRKFVSGPFDVGFGMLLSPTCSMAAQGEEGSYAHPHRVVAPILPLQELIDKGAIKPGAVDHLRAIDGLANYLYVPPLAHSELPESVALLYAPVTLHHDYLEDRRIAQLSEVAAIHLKRQLALHFTGSVFRHEAFSD